MMLNLYDEVWKLKQKQAADEPEVENFAARIEK